MMPEGLKQPIISAVAYFQMDWDVSNWLQQRLFKETRTNFGQIEPCICGMRIHFHSSPNSNLVPWNWAFCCICSVIRWSSKTSPAQQWRLCWSFSTRENWIHLRSCWLKWASSLTSTKWWSSRTCLWRCWRTDKTKTFRTYPPFIVQAGYKSFNMFNILRSVTFSGIYLSMR